jgi:hypothetical protein
MSELEKLETRVHVLEDVILTLKQQIVALQNRMRIMEGTQVRYPSIQPIGDPCVFWTETEEHNFG